ncbi:MAG TPA: acylphosphatase [Candidatus Latescibacteria bacterium]|nr:acylphosphatase [Candidatus Latescibacterota bacterium]
MPSGVRAHIIVSGVVQGVGYRFFAQRVALNLGLTGYVRNLPNGKVEVEVEGKQGPVDEFIRELRRGPWSAHVTALSVEWSEYRGQFEGFQIRF